MAYDTCIARSIAHQDIGILIIDASHEEGHIVVGQLGPISCEGTMAKIRRSTVQRNHGFIVEIVKRPPEEWDEKLIQAYRLIQLKVAADCPEAGQELREFGEIATALRATELYQQRMR